MVNLLEVGSASNMRTKVGWNTAASFMTNSALADPVLVLSEEDGKLLSVAVHEQLPVILATQMRV